jgi:hypothetical protein
MTDPTPAYTIGPLFSHWGLKNWMLHLHPDFIEAEPLGMSLSIQAGVRAAIGHGALADTAYDPAGRTDAPAARKNAEIYRLDKLLRIVVRCRLFSANEVILHWMDGRSRVLGIGFRPATDEIRTALATLYPDLYREDGFRDRSGAR